MKGPAQSRPSKASLVARGLAAKPVKGKRNVKSKKVPDGRVGYSLYSTDSEDQASSVGRGLDRCAALLTNILDSDSKDPRKKKSLDSKQVIKARGRAASTRSTPSTRSASTPSTRSVPVKGKAVPAKSKAIVIPTASQKDQGPTTAYNDRLVASTPLLNSEERIRQHHLLEREQKLTHQIQQLRQHFELLQQQKSPEIQEQQKRSLQDSMLHELNEYQQKEYQQKEYQQKESPNVIQQISSNNSAPGHSASQDEISTGLASNGTPGARRSLDFYHSHGTMEERTRKESPIEVGQASHNVDYFQSSTSPSRTRGDSLRRPKKQVRVVSPDVYEQYKPSSRSQTKTVSFSKNTSPNEHVSSIPSKSRMSRSPVAAENQVRSLQYLTRELREVIGRSDDMEVNRLLLEIDQTCSLLPYMYTQSNSSSSSEGGGREHPDIHQLKLENEQLRRSLQFAEGKSREQEGLMQNYENMQKGHSNISFELAACRSENASLQKKLQEENETKGKLTKEIEILEKVVTDIKDKMRFVQILDNKEQEHSKRRRSGQQEMLRLSNDIKRLKAEVESSKLSVEAAQKEGVIMTLSLKQKDTEIERLNELTRSLHQSTQRVMGDIQTYQPNSLFNDGLVSRSENIKQFADMDHFRPTLTSTRSRDYQRTSSGIHITTQPRDINTSAILEHRPTSLDLDPQMTNNHPFGRRRSFEGFQKKSPRLSTGEYQHIIHQGKNSYQTPLISPDGPAYFSPKASLGLGAWTAGDSAYLSPEYKNKSTELSSLSSRDEEEFQRDLESLDAEIARVQRSLQETAKRTSNN